MTLDIREALAADLRRMGLMGPESESTRDVGIQAARRAAWGAYGMTPPPIAEPEDGDEA